MVDLFAGAGGLSEGFVRAGFEVFGAVEVDETAARTYRLNHPGVPDERVLVDLELYSLLRPGEDSIHV